MNFTKVENVLGGNMGEVGVKWEKERKIDVGERDRLEAVHECKVIERRKRIQLAVGIQWEEHVKCRWCMRGSQFLVI